MSYLEITCHNCHEHIGWMTDSGPGPMFICDSCKDYEDENPENEEEEDES